MADPFGDVLMCISKTDLCCAAQYVKSIFALQQTHGWRSTVARALPAGLIGSAEHFAG